MEMQDRSSFENEWEKAFAEAESAPPGNVWDKLEVNLANSTSGMYKKRLTFFKTLAAASIFLAFSIGGIAVYQEYFHFHDHGNVVVDENENSVETPLSEPKENSTQGPDLANNDNEKASGDLKGVITSKDEIVEKSSTGDKDLDDMRTQNADHPNKTLKGTNGSVNQLMATAEKEEHSDTNRKIVDKQPDLVKDKRSNVVKESLDITTQTLAINEPKNTDVINDNKSETTGGASSKNQFTEAGRDGDNETVAKNNFKEGARKSDVGQSVARIDELTSDQEKRFSESSVVVNDNTKEFTDKRLVESLEEVPDELNGIYALLEVDDEIAEPELQMVPWYAKASKQKVKYQKLWAGLSLARGSFDPNGLGMGELNNSAEEAVVDLPLQPASFNGLLRNSSPSITDETEGSSFNIGVNFGSQIAKRWIIQSGISYLEQNTASSSNALAIDEASRDSDPLTELNNDAFQDFVIIGDYGISNSYKSISIPIQAGYILLDRKFNITLLGGISNDFLIAKRIKDVTGNLETVTLAADEVSNLNTYNISGIVGSEFGYDFGGNYLISLNPQIRQSFNTFNQGDGTGNGMPIGFEVGFRFKYLLK